MITKNAKKKVTKPINTERQIMDAQKNIALLFNHTAFMLVSTAVAKSTRRSINIGCVNAVIKNTRTVNAAPTMVPMIKNVARLAKVYASFSG